MEATLRRTMTSFTETIFPVSKSAKDPQRHHILKAGNDYVTHLPLQMAIYFNGFFAPFWLTSILVIFELKYPHLSTLYRITLVAIYITFTIIEVVRLYIGYLGNLMERVPELAGFWLLTILLQTPLIILLVINNGSMLVPMERAVHIIEAAFIFVEIICGYFAIRTMVNYQVTKFHLRQFTDLEQMPDDEYWMDAASEHEHYA